jgi:hypothetical protein
MIAQGFFEFLNESKYTSWFNKSGCFALSKKIARFGYLEQ